MQHARQHLHDLVRGLLSEAAAAGLVRDDVPADELAGYCLHALDAAGSSSAAQRRLVGVVLDGLAPRTRTWPIGPSRVDEDEQAVVAVAGQDQHLVALERRVVVRVCCWAPTWVLGVVQPRPPPGRDPDDQAAPALRSPERVAGRQGDA